MHALLGAAGREEREEVLGLERDTEPVALGEMQAEPLEELLRVRRQRRTARNQITHLAAHSFVNREKDNRT